MQEKICPKCKTPFLVEKNNKKKFCSRKCANSRFWSEEHKKKISASARMSTKVRRANELQRQKFRKLWIKKKCVCGKEFETRPSKKTRYCSLKCANKLSGGYRKGSGRGKSGWYKGVWCDSSYELAWVIYNLEHNIVFQRNTEGFKYIHKNEEHEYFPDFICNNIYFEIKGYKSDIDKSKFLYFPHNLKVLYKKDLHREFKYVTKKYGPNFIELYEGNPHNQKNNKCLICNKPARRHYCSRECSGKAAFLRNHGTACRARTERIQD